MVALKSLKVDVIVTIGGSSVALWRVRVVGWVARLLGVPVSVRS